MRADRLLAMLMTLQTRGKMTAADLAQDLEVSERTIYRDVEALGTAGVPVYAERGPGGGISLLEAYRTNLTGLNADEARALFMLSIPTPLLQLGVGQELKAALLKVTAALPENSPPRPAGRAPANPPGRELVGAIGAARPAPGRRAAVRLAGPRAAPRGAHHLLG